MSAGLTPLNRVLPGLRRRRARLALLAVPVLLLRAFLPPGFMPIAAADGWIGFCPGAAPLPPGLAASPAHAHHHMPGQSLPGKSGAGTTEHSAPCLFAAGAVCAGTPAVLVLMPPAVATLPYGSLRRGAVFSPTILRVQSPRGPPLPAA